MEPKLKHQNGQSHHHSERRVLRSRVYTFAKLHPLSGFLLMLGAAGLAVGLRG